MDDPVEINNWRSVNMELNVTDPQLLNSSLSENTTNSTFPDMPHRNRDPLASLTFVIIYSIASFVGVIGNILVIIVYKKKRDRKGSSCFILVLAIIDLIVCIFLMPLDITRKRWLWDEDFLLGIPHTIFLWLRNMSLELQVVVLAAIAVDRFFAICKPLSFTMTWKRAIKTTIIATTVLFMCELGNACARMMYDGYYPTVDKIIKYVYMGGILIALIIMAVLYIKIYMVVVERTKKKSKKVGPEKNYSYTSEPDLDSTHSNLPLSDTSSHQESPNNTFRGDINPGNPASPAVKNKNSYTLPTARSQSVSETEARKTSTVGRSRVISDPGVGQSTTPTGRYAKFSNILASLPRRSNGQVFPKQSSRRNHIKTAKMLFLVTLVFVLSWVPPNLINLKIVPYSSLVFSLFYVNNVANPIIYSFLNRRFREDVKKLTRRMCRRAT